jgi:hypothetical protein
MLIYFSNLSALNIFFKFSLNSCSLNNEYKKKKKSSRIEMITSTNKRLNSECDEQEVEFLEENLEKSRSSIDDQEESISIQNEDDDLRSSEDDENDDDDQLEDDNESLIARSYYGSLQKLNISGSSNNLRVKQPHIIYLEFEVKNREVIVSNYFHNNNTIIFNTILKRINRQKQV